MRILVYGTGAIGGYLGGVLLHQGHDLVFLSRPRVAERFRDLGLTLSDFTGKNHQLEQSLVTIQSLSELEGKVDLVLLTVKCTSVDEAAVDLAQALDKQTPVLCLQNGVGSAQRAAQHLAPSQVLSGIVGFNVATLEGGRLHRGTDGAVITQAHPLLQPFLDSLDDYGVPVESSQSFESVAWGKLLLNLNNAINALAGVPLVEELSQRPYRLVLAACQKELLKALKAKGIRPAKLAKLPPALIPWVLWLPNWLFKVLARKMLAIDPLARSSMFDDLARDRRTEISFLNGAVVELAGEFGLSTPVNEAVTLLVKEAESSGNGSPRIPARDLLARVGLVAS